MMTATPRDAAPDDVRRAQLVARVMEGLEGIESLPLAEQTARMAQAQRALSGVLSNDPTIIQAGLPGLDE